MCTPMSTLFTEPFFALLSLLCLPLCPDLTAACEPPAPAPPEMDDSRSSYDPADIASSALIAASVQCRVLCRMTIAEGRAM